MYRGTEADLVVIQVKLIVKVEVSTGEVLEVYLVAEDAYKGKNKWWVNQASLCHNKLV